jgi:seryl-tRNA synthetase
MFDLKLIRENPADVRARLASKNVEFDGEALLQLDRQHREIMARVEGLRSRQNAANDEISQLLKQKKDAKENIAAMKTISAQIGRLEPELKELKSRIDQHLMGIPNLPHPSVPVGDTTKNKVVRAWGEAKKCSFKPKTHIELAESLDIVDFKRAAKITGSNFIVYKNAGARMERALLNFMLDVHTQDNKYKEIFPPFLVNRASMTGTGQLPKMEEDMYKLKDEDLFLIPTAEVPVTNLHRDEILSEEELPIYYAAYSACFRREAGSYGKDTKGLMRVHQFDKVELVKFVKPQHSYDELEQLVNDAEGILQKLGLPYRVVMLASGDLSFAAAKCYDLEAYAAGLDQWLEVSSCSNFEDFQARRSNIRFSAKGGTGKGGKKTMLVHTLNGSGVALARTMIAILENYQTEEGDVTIPSVLRPYMGGMDRIEK